MEETSYEPAVIEIGLARLPKARADKIYHQALEDTGARDTPNNRAAIARVTAGFELLGWGEIANRLVMARRTLRGSLGR